MWFCYMTALPKLRQKIRSLGHMAEEKVIAELQKNFPGVRQIRSFFTMKEVTDNAPLDF